MGSIAEPHVDTVAHLESICAGFLNALNERRLDPNDAEWQRMSKHIRIALDHAFRQDLPGLNDPERLVTLSEWLDSWKKIFNRLPTYRYRLLDMATVLDPKGGHAIVYMNKEMTGDPEGVITQNFGICEFMYKAAEEKWLCTNVRCVRGLREYDPAPTIDDSLDSPSHCAAILTAMGRKGRIEHQLVEQL